MRRIGSGPAAKTNKSAKKYKHMAEKWHSIRSISKETNRSTWPKFEILALFTSPV